MFDGDNLFISNFMKINDLKPLIESIMQSVMLETHYIDETSYPAGFDIKKFKSIPSFAGRIKYAKQYLQGLGSGTARIALAIDPNTVIKIAKNPKGVAQNKTEIDVGNVGYKGTAEVKDHDPEGLWVEMERAQKFSTAKFKQATGFGFHEFGIALNYWYRMNKQSIRGYAPPQAPNQDVIEETELFTNITTLVGDFDMPIGDLVRPSSWGIVNRGGREVPVLIDFGVTTDIMKTFYTKE